MAVLTAANSDLEQLSSCYELDSNYYFFKTRLFDIWCDIAEISTETKQLIKKRSKKKYRIFKKILRICEKDKSVKIENGHIIIMGCIKRILYKFEENEDTILYIEASRVKRKPALRIKF
ncbi:MAG TPA: hypothetical protein ENG87_05390 [Candidatus Pacearchaeota archaeon]|nr:hypothetical protein [Candidatus Pacearchaeota archaeon]